MTKSLINKLPKGKTMEFKQNNEVVIVDEKVTTVFKAKQVTPETTDDYPCAPKDSACSKRWIDAYSDCA